MPQPDKPKPVAKKKPTPSPFGRAEGISRPPESPVKQLWNAAKEGVKGALNPAKTLMKYRNVTEPKSKSLRKGR